MSHWYYNTSSGAMQHVTLPLVGQLTSLFPQITGWHELHISGDATLAQAEAEARKEFPGAAPPTTSVSTATGQQVTSEAKTVLPGFTGLAAIGDFFQRLTQGSTWIRLGEGLLGIVLIAIGIARITHAVPAATRIARTAGAAALV